MRTFVASYLASGLVFVVADFVWLSVAGNALYRPLLGDLLLPSFAPVPAAAFYLLYVVGIVVLAILPAFESGRWTTALGHGALLGLVAYGTYDLTNQATLKGWSTMVTVVDIGWGAALTAAAATLGYLIADYAVGPPPA